LEVKQLHAITPTSFREFFEKFILIPKTRKMLIIEIFANEIKTPQPVLEAQGSNVTPSSDSSSSTTSTTSTSSTSSESEPERIVSITHPVQFNRSCTLLPVYV